MPRVLYLDHSISLSLTSNGEIASRLWEGDAMFRCIRTGQGVMRAVPYYSGYSQESAVRQEVLFRASGHTINPVPRGANAVN